MRAAIYARVSTANNGQDPHVQTRELGEFCERRGWTLADYVDIGISGTKEKRPALDRLMADAHKRKFDVVVVWKFDRFAIGVSLASGAGDLQRVRNRFREPVRAARHVHAHRENGVHRFGCRGRDSVHTRPGRTGRSRSEILRRRDYF
jgi:hypothetical protein